jgi:hypothetical protein
MSVPLLRQLRPTIKPCSVSSGAKIDDLAFLPGGRTGGWVGDGQDGNSQAGNGAMAVFMPSELTVVLRNLEQR